jgi:hypothetical protein
MLEDDNAKLIELPDRNEARAAGDKARREIEAIIENVKVIAKMRRAAFLAYVDEGFTIEQALHLCCK